MVEPLEHDKGHTKTLFNSREWEFYRAYFKYTGTLVLANPISKSELRSGRTRGRERVITRSSELFARFNNSLVKAARLYDHNPYRNCPTCSQVPIRAGSDFPHVAAGGHMVWPGLEPHRLMIDKIIFKFCVLLLGIFFLLTIIWKENYNFKCRTLLCFIIFYIVYSILQSEYFRKKIINNVIYF